MDATGRTRTTDKGLRRGETIPAQAQGKQHADRRRLPMCINPTKLQSKAAGMWWGTGDTFANNVDRVNQGVYEAARRAHQEEGSAATRGGNRRP